MDNAAFAPGADHHEHAAKRRARDLAMAETPSENRTVAAAHRADLSARLRGRAGTGSLPHCQDARPKVDAWRKTLPQDLKYIEHVAKWRDREGAAFAYRIESVPSFVVNGKYLIAIDSWEPEHTDAAIALVSELAGLEPAD